MGMILEKQWQFTAQDHKSHHEILFELPATCRGFRILFSFDPMEITKKEDIEKALEAGMNGADYNAQEAKVFMAEYELSLYNHLTLTLYRNQAFIGANHRHETQQDLTFTAGSSPLGFLPLAEFGGAYEVILSLQACFGDVQATLRVEVADD